MEEVNKTLDASSRLKADLTRGLDAKLRMPLASTPPYAGSAQTNIRSVYKPMVNLRQPNNTLLL